MTIPTLGEICDSFGRYLSGVLVTVVETPTDSLHSQLQGEPVDLKVHLIKEAVAFRHYLELDFED